MALRSGCSEPLLGRARAEPSLQQVPGDQADERRGDRGHAPERLLETRLRTMTRELHRRGVQYVKSVLAGADSED